MLTQLSKPVYVSLKPMLQPAPAVGLTAYSCLKGRSLAFTFVQSAPGRQTFATAAGDDCLVCYVLIGYAHIDAYVVCCCSRLMYSCHCHTSVAAIALQCSTVQYSAVQHSTVTVTYMYSTVQHSTVQCRAVQCSAAQKQCAAAMPVAKT